ncbi:putative MFS multidrug transporter [Jaminaea rosea]|uniref:Putative MFS multidrug transporter n=1 Tax=Jaminaea rosea TaxID=1569628 RepID=A0A316UYR1_9BASI|nr:putative MFS multidrug transporter [Jaminaea rosea]PWN28285.1 putative MFS multidrug transporter [Jaminaea rosea]
MADHDNPKHPQQPNDDIEQASATHRDSSTSLSTSKWTEFSIFDRRQKALLVAIVSIAATFSGAASNIYFPALSTIADDLGVSIELINLTVTTYLIFQGLAPSLWGPVSDVHGRRVALLGTFLVFLGACIGLACSQNYATLLVLRCLQSTGSASTIALGSGVIGDITTRAERAGFMGIFQAGLLAPVAIGPIIGGALADSLGWRSVFWFLVIYGGCYFFVIVAFLPETLRSLVADGSHIPESRKLLIAFPLSLYQRTTKSGWKVGQPSANEVPPPKRIDFLAPFRSLLSKYTAPIIFFMAIYYAVWQMTITAMSTLFKTQYGLSELQIGLSFIANGVGCILGTLFTGKLLDRNYQRVKRKHQGPEEDLPIEKARLLLVPIFSAIQCLAILLFGWTIAYPHKVPIAIPIIATFFVGATAIGMQSGVMTYLVDVYPDQSAAASASLNLARCLLAAGATSLVSPLINAVGVGPAFSIATGVQVLAFAGFIIQWVVVPKWREAKANERTASATTTAAAAK